MRHISMNRFALTFAAAALFSISALSPSASAQVAVPPSSGHQFKDTSVLTQAQANLPAGKHVAIYEFEDLECPACAKAFPIVHQAVEHYKIPLIRHDFPLRMHIWSRDAAVTARYLQDKVSPDMAEQFRRDVFANQQSIASKDDLNNYTRSWFSKHGQQTPFVMDPSGRFAAEVQSDETLGERIGLVQTPSIFILAPKGWVELNDITQLYAQLDQSLAQPTGKPAIATRKAVGRSNLRRPATAQK